jgi:hypothetical protein
MAFLPIVPVRKVRAEKPLVHWETISVTLVSRQVALASATEFASGLDRLSDTQIPRIKECAENPEIIFSRPKHRTKSNVLVPHAHS